MKAWYLGELRKKNHEGRWLRIFQPGKKEAAHLEKMTKGKSNQKGRPEKVKSRSLGKRKNKGQPFRTPKKGKSAGVF